MLSNFPNNEDNFILSGGTSFKAIQFLGIFEQEAKNKLISISDEKFIDILLNKTFEDLKNYIKNAKHSISSPILKRSHDAKLNDEPIKRQALYKYNKIFISKNYKPHYNESNAKFQTFNENTRLKIVVLWKYNTGKCIDATVLLTNYSIIDGKVYIGSHSNLFAAVDINTGTQNWTFYAKDRIESSACLSKCGNYVVFGKYW